MEQQQYRMNPGAMPKRENRFLRIWGPLLVKWGVGLAVSMFAMFILEGIFIIKKSGFTPDSVQNYAQIRQFLQQYLSDAANSQEFMNEMATELLKYTTPIEGLASFVTIPILMVMFHRDSIRQKLAGFIPNRKAAVWKYAGVVVMSLALTLGYNNLINISGLASSSEEFGETMELLYSSSFPVQMICLGILIPVCEEFVFRGLMFRRIRQGDTFLRSAVYTSLVFGLLHMNIVQGLYGFFMGMVFCYLYEKYGSVKAPVLAHVTANVLSVVMTQVKALEWMAAAPVRMGGITIACAAVASTMYVLIQRIDERPGEEGANRNDQSVMPDQK